MKTLILADLHDDDWTFYSGPGPLVGCEHVLSEVQAVILAGDVANQGPARWPGAIGRVRDAVSDVPIYVFPGNHEYYWAFDDLFHDDTLLKEAAEGVGAIYAQQLDVVIGETEVLMATLWTDMKLSDEKELKFIRSREGMLDYQNIPRHEHGGWRTLRPADTIARHHEHLDWLTQRLRQPKATKERIVVTHHSPLPFSTKERQPTGSYASDLVEYIEHRAPDAWYFGHTHKQCSWMIGATEVRNMSFGRPQEAWDRKEEILQRLIVDL